VASWHARMRGVCRVPMKDESEGLWGRVLKRADTRAPCHLSAGRRWCATIVCSTSCAHRSPSSRRPSAVSSSCHRPALSPFLLSSSRAHCPSVFTPPYLRRVCFVCLQSLELVYSAIFINTVPDMWTDAAYPSLKPLGFWFGDLLLRVAALRAWLTGGPPHAFWLSGFFFPPSPPPRRGRRDAARVSPGGRREVRAGSHDAYPLFLVTFHVLLACRLPDSGAADVCAQVPRLHRHDPLQVHGSLTNARPDCRTPR